jgi:uncharacterized protein YktA (UPF0223 family)
MNTQAKNYSDVAAAKSYDSSNHNISSVLSQIQDDGPAYSEARKRDNLVQLRADENKISPEARVEKLLENDLYSNESTLSPGNALRSKKNNTKTWIFISLLLFMIIGVAFFIYELENRTNKIETLLSEFNSDREESIESYNKVSPTIVSLNTELASVQNELEQIKYKTEKVVPENPQIDNSVIYDEIVSTLNDEIQILKIQLEKANNALNLKQSESNIVQIKDIELVAKQVVTWKVNLASLSNKEKVDEIVNRLTKDGLKPLIDPAVVDGKHVYRLSVIGFAEIKQAEQFIQIAEEKYGMKGAWIRKVKNG